MELALAVAALALTVVALVLTVVLRRKVADLQAGLHAANEALAGAQLALTDQVNAAEDRAMRTTVETRADIEAYIASVAMEADSRANEVAAQIGAVQDETMRTLGALRSEQESGNAAVVAEVAAMIDKQKEFLRSDLEARLAERDG